MYSFIIDYNEWSPSRTIASTHLTPGHRKHNIVIINRKDSTDKFVSISKEFSGVVCVGIPLLSYCVKTSTYQ